MDFDTLAYTATIQRQEQEYRMLQIYWTEIAFAVLASQ
jgi:hypothetical protein